MKLSTKTRVTRISAADQAIAIWFSNGEPEKLYMRTASDAVGFIKSLTALGRKYGGVRLIQNSLKSEVNSNGAVSPAARASASMTPVRIPGKAVGRITLVTTCVGVAPIPIAASRIRDGTRLMASSAVSMIVGSMSNASAAPPAGAENPPVTTTTVANANTPAKIEGRPVRTFAAN